MSNLELQQYLFDLQGYLVIEDVLSKEEIDTLNTLLDKQDIQMTGERKNFGRAPEGGSGFLEWGKPFCDLLDHPTIMPILQFRLGDCFRLDRLFGFQLREGTPGGDLHADYGASKTIGREKGLPERYLKSEARPGKYFHTRDNEILNGFVVVSWNLTDTGPDMGGVCCIPGSHKSNYRLPQTIFDAPEKAPCVVIPSAPAGSVILFTEALTHGSTDWKGKHDRRTILYKYCVSHMSWSGKLVEPPTNTKLTPRQKILFENPGDPYRHFSSLFEE